MYHGAHFVCCLVTSLDLSVERLAISYSACVEGPSARVNAAFPPAHSLMCCGRGHPLEPRRGAEVHCVFLGGGLGGIFWAKDQEHGTAFDVGYWRGNGGCSHLPVRLTSMAVTHFTQS